MNKIRYQTFLLTRVLQGNGYPSTQALLKAIDAACAIPEAEFASRKAAFNEIGDKAPLRNGTTSDICVTYREIPGFLEREWYEFASFSAAIKNITKDSDLDAAVRNYWLTDEQIAFHPDAMVNVEAQSEPAEDEEPSQRM